MNKLLSPCIALFTLMGLVFGAYFYIDARYALSATVKQIEQRLDYKIVSDQYNENQKRLWQIQDRYENQVIPHDVQEQIRELKQQQENLQWKMKKLEQ